MTQRSIETAAMLFVKRAQRIGTSGQSKRTLNEKAAIAARATGNYLLQCLKSRCPEADEAAFVDGIGRSLSAGDFLLLIVGDGIRYGAESLVAFLERYGNLRFGLSLIEIAAYRLPDGRTLLQPRVLAKTEILQRTLVLGPQGPLTFQEAAQAEDSSTTANTQREWFTSFWKGVRKDEARRPSSTGSRAGEVHQSVLPDAAERRNGVD